MTSPDLRPSWMPSAWRTARNGSMVSTRYKNDDNSESTVQSFVPDRTKYTVSPNNTRSAADILSAAPRDRSGLTDSGAWDAFFKHPSPQVPSLAPVTQSNAAAMAEHFTPGRGNFSFGASDSPLSTTATTPRAPVSQPSRWPTVLPTREYGTVTDSGVSRALNPQGFLTTTTQGGGGNFISPMSTSEMRQTELQYAPRDSAGFPAPVTGQSNYMQRLKRIAG